MALLLLEPYKMPAHLHSHCHASIDLATLGSAAQPHGWLADFALRRLPKAYLLSTPGQQANQVFVVRTGRLRVYLAGASRELSLAFLEPGDIYTTHTPAYVQTMASSELWIMDLARFALQLAHEPNIHPAIMRVMGRLLSNAVALIDDLAFREVPARLARFLVGLAQRRAQLCEQGWLLELDLSTQDIASLLGSTRQTVSSLLNQWQRDGLLQRQGRRRLLICSLDALQAHAGPLEKTS